MRIKLPKGFEFDGAKFGKKFFPDFDPNVPDPRFWFDGEGYLICPSLPDDTDISDCFAEAESFPKPKNNPKEAFDTMLAESKNSNPMRDTLEIIFRNAIVYIEDLEKRITKLEGKA